MDKRADLRQYYQAEASKQHADKQHQESVAQFKSLDSTLVQSFGALIKFMDGKTTKTEVVNQPKSISTPDVDKVVQAVDSLPSKLKKQADESVQKVDVQNLDFSKLSEAITGLTKVEGKKGDKGEDGHTPVKGVDYTDGKDGRTVELRTNSTHIQYRYEGEATWTDIISTNSLKGERGYTPIKGVDYFDGKDGKDAVAKDGKDGAEVELRKTAKQIQWRRKGGKWAILVKLADLKGDTGKHVGGGGGGPGIVKAVIAGTGISIDSTDVYNPIISATGLAEASDLTAHTGNTSNPHSVTKAQVGLGNVDNTSDANKTISTATQTALNGKFTQRTITGTTNQVTVTNGDGVSGNPTLSLPQDIHTGASPTFAGLTVDTGTLFVDAANNRIGIRTSAPLAELQVVGTSANVNGNGIIRFDTNTGTSDRGVKIGALGNAGTAGYAYIQAVKTEVSSDSILSINPGGGNIGIGTTAPAEKLTVAGNAAPTTDSTYTLGTSSLYWSNTYTDRLYLNSTAYLDGGTAGIINITGALGPITSTAGSAANNQMYINTGATGNRASINLRGYNASNSGDFFTTEMRTDTAELVMYVYDASVLAYLTFLNFSYLSGVLAFSQNLAITDAKNIALGSTTGTKIGTATTQKLGFFNATPVVRPSATPANATDLATALTLVNDLKSKLVTLGLIA